MHSEPCRDGAAAAWHAESIVRFLCSTYAGRIAGVRANQDGFMVITAEVPRDEPVAVTSAVGPDGRRSCG